MQIKNLFENIGIKSNQFSEGDIFSISPLNGELIGKVTSDTEKSINEKIIKSNEAFKEWRKVPAPKRGELIRIFGNKLRQHKNMLGELVTVECGKILQEGLGEVQEMIDICDFAVGLSRQLYGLTISSERPGHRMQETWQPMGPVGIISAFNFPVAVWAWNTALAVVCGDSVIWKPSEKTPLCALACQALFEEAQKEFKESPENLSQIIFGFSEAGQQLVNDVRVPVISATGSCAMGQKVGQQVAARFGRSILELGGNNGIIVCPTADLNMAATAIVFGAVGTAGQRCTSTRRLFLHDSVYDLLIQKLQKAYLNIPVANPLQEKTLVGPLIDEASFDGMQIALDAAKNSKCIVLGGERIVNDVTQSEKDSFYVKPALVEVYGDEENGYALDVSEETFAPILYVFRYNNLEKAIAVHNNVPQGLSSAIFTNDIREAELFISSTGSDCGIANVNIGTSGAEIGGAFGGEKATGGGRESGSDAWKGYMRRMTTTINYSKELPLAQGIQFNL